MDFQYRILGIL